MLKKNCQLVLIQKQMENIMDNNKLFVEFLIKNNLLEEYQRILEVLNEPSNSVARYSDQDIYLLNNLVRQKD